MKGEQVKFKNRSGRGKGRKKISDKYFKKNLHFIRIGF